MKKDPYIWRTLVWLSSTKRKKTEKKWKKGLRFPKRNVLQCSLYVTKGDKGKGGDSKTANAGARNHKEPSTSTGCYTREWSQITTKGAILALTAQAFCNFCLTDFRIAMDQWLLCESHYSPWMGIFITFVSFGSTLCLGWVRRRESAILLCGTPELGKLHHNLL